MPPIALVAIVAIAVAGRLSGPTPEQAPVASPAVGAVVAVVEPSGLRGTPSPRSDWPDAISNRTVPSIRRHETGTDGLMGSLPFDLPPDESGPMVNRFTIDDVVASWAAWDTTPPWVRRLGALSSYRADPYQR